MSGSLHNNRKDQCHSTPLLGLVRYQCSTCRPRFVLEGTEGSVARQLATRSRFSLSWSSPAKGSTTCLRHAVNSSDHSPRGRIRPLSRAAHAFAATCPFHLSVINDEITPDFGRACEIATKDFGLHWIELRSMWNKNITDLDAKEIAESKRILEKYQLRVTDIASPLFKVDWPGAPLSKSSPKRTSSMPTSISNSRTHCWNTASSWPSNSKPTASAASTSGAWTTRPRTAPPSTTSCARPRRPARKAT